MKVRALKSFEGIRDNERNVYPKEGDVWETSEERANFLKEHGVVEIVEENEVDVVLSFNEEKAKHIIEKSAEEETAEEVIKKVVEEAVEANFKNKSKKKKTKKDDK